MVERSALESEIIRKCLSRSELQCSFVEYRGYKVVYRRYARYDQRIFHELSFHLFLSENTTPHNN